MLRCVSVLQVEHVVPQVVPEPSLHFDKVPQYKELLERTVAIAAGAVVVADVPGTSVFSPPGTDRNAFWGPPPRR